MAKVNILNKENTILNKFLAEMRDKSVQKDSMRFRRNMERVGEIMRDHFAQMQIGSDVYVCKVSNRGARVLND